LGLLFESESEFDFDFDFDLVFVSNSNPSPCASASCPGGDNHNLAFAFAHALCPQGYNAVAGKPRDKPGKHSLYPNGYNAAAGKPRDKPRMRSTSLSQGRKQNRNSQLTPSTFLSSNKLTKLFSKSSLSEKSESGKTG
jgi:hypothetical protein